MIIRFTNIVIGERGSIRCIGKRDASQSSGEKRSGLGTETKTHGRSTIF